MPIYRASKLRYPVRLEALLSRLSPGRAAQQVARSELFDAAYYSAAYDDVRASGLPPLTHYMEIGAGELRDTSPHFKARALLRFCPSFRPGRDNPVLFLEAWRSNESGEPFSLPNEPKLTAGDFLALLNAPAVRSETAATPAVDVIVPVHNNLARLLPLLDTLRRNTEPHHRVILIDDASSEPGVTDALRKFAEGRDGTKLITNPRNLGFAASVNMGLRHSDRHKVILNSDTIVPRHWLDVLVEPVLRDPTIASVTPYSNSSSYTGFPHDRIELPLAGCADLETINEALAKFPALDRDIVSGVGFCMALNARAVSTVGMLDDDSFRDGYYEETHWCYRAGRAGFRNVLANRLYVAHDHASSSFGLRRKLKALGRGEAAMRKAFPGYFDEMEMHYASDPHGALRRQCCLSASCLAGDTTAIIEQDEAVWPPGTQAEMAAMATGTGSVLMLVHHDNAHCTVTAHTPRYGEIEVTGSFGEVADLLRLLGNVRISCGASCSPEVAARWQDKFNISAPQVTCSTADNPNQIYQPPPFCIAVLGTRPLASQPKRVRQLIDHIVRGNKSCRLVIFGEPPDAWITDERISKTGIYRHENIPAILRHHRASVAYFPNTRDPFFPAVRRDILAMGLPLLCHDPGRGVSSDTGSANGTVLGPAGTADTYAELERLHEAHVAGLHLPH